MKVTHLLETNQLSKLKVYVQMSCRFIRSVKLNLAEQIWSVSNICITVQGNMHGNGSTLIILIYTIS